MKQGKFISFEGIDGSGKTTQSRLFFNHIVKNGQKAHWTREVGGTDIAEKIREVMLAGEMTATTEFFLVMAARNDHLYRIIKPTIAKGEWIICDRFVDSTACYQGCWIGANIIYDMHSKFLGNFMPDYTILIDIEPKLAHERIKERGISNRIDKHSLDFFTRLRDHYLKIADSNPNRVKIIDGSKAQDEVHQKVIDIINY